MSYAVVRGPWTSFGQSSSRWANGANGVWQIDGQIVPGRDVIRRDPNYVPFETVYFPTSPTTHPLLNQYPVLGRGGGYQALAEWETRRPNYVGHYAPFNGDGRVAVNHELSSAAYPWYYDHSFQPGYNQPLVFPGQNGQTGHQWLAEEHPELHAQYVNRMAQLQNQGR